MNGLERFSAWRGRNVLVVDIIATLIWAFLILGIAAYTGDTPGILFAYGTSGQVFWSFVSLIPVALRRWSPRVAALLYAGLVVAHLIVGPAMLYSDFFSLLMVYSVIVYGNPRSTKPFIVLSCATGLMAAMLMTWAVDVGPLFGAAWRNWRAMYYGDCSTVYEQGLNAGCASQLVQETMMLTLLIGACLAATFVLAYWQRARQATVRMMRERNDAIAARQEEEKHIAALAERARIARDMHDVVAHTLSIIIIQSDGGRYAGANDPAVARSTMATIRHESERALHDMKRLLGVFGGSSHADYDDIGALIDQAGHAAPDCTITRRIAGRNRSERLGTDASVAVYRVVQEALTNVRKYAGPRVNVDIDERWDDAGLTIVVSDNGRGASSGLDGHKPGYGLIGMRERVEAVGGTVSAGPGIGGGYVVQAWLPYHDTVESRPTAGAKADAGVDAGRGAVAASNASAPTASSDSVPTLDRSSRRDAVPRTSTSRTAASRIAGSGSVRPERSGFALPERLSPPSLRDVLAAMRSKPIDQARSAGGERFNLIERLSQWSERHYLLMDTLETVLLIVLMSTNFFIDSDFVINTTTYETRMAGLFITVMVLGPLAFRRRFPEGSAAFIAVFCAFELLVLSGVPFANIWVLYALYSASAYGRPHAWIWLVVASLADSGLFGVKLVTVMLGYDTAYQILFMPPDAPIDILGAPMSVSVIVSLAVFLLCCAAIGYGQWTRARGTNALILQAREEALKAERDKQRVLAANMERDRISATIQAEVTATLTGVIDQAAEGLRMLDDAASRGETPAPQTIIASFEAIGRQGRAALAHMRQLLGVLRETGFSDDHEHERMRLTPAASLDEQLKAAAS